MVHPLKRPLQAAELARHLALDLRGMDVAISRVASLDDATAGALIFSKNAPAPSIAGTVCIAPEGAEPASDGALLVSAQPRLDYIRALLLLEDGGYLLQDETPPRIHPTAKIGQGVVIGPGCTIGEGVVIEPNTVVLNGTQIGANCRIGPNCSIGVSGFGYERAEDGTPYRFVHLGRVVIGENVDIGANTCIAHGTLSDTVIKDCAKIDNLVHVAHNVTISQNAMVIAGAEISGGCRIGEAAWIGPNACIREKIEIGDGALIGIGATVVASVPPGEVHAGNPARPFRKR